MRLFGNCIGIVTLVVLAAGCASVRTDKEWTQLKMSIREQTGNEVLWEQSEEESVAIRKEVDRLLAGGLSRDEAVRVALLNNSSLQSVFEDIGIAKSDLIQAGLFHNPSISAFFRFPFSGSGTNSKAEGGMSLVDFWQIPFRKKVALANLEKEMMKVEHMVLQTAREAKQAYDSLYYLTLARNDTQAIFDKLKDITHEVETRKQFGFLSELDVYLAQIMETESEIALHRNENKLSMAKAHLDRVLGLEAGQAGYRIADKSLDELPPIPGLEEAVEYALGHRFDIQMAQFRIGEAERKLKLEKVRVLKEVSLGASYEREIEGDEVFGPGIDIQIPIFDQNQAQIAKAEFLVRKARKRLEALEAKTREEIASDLSQVELHTKSLKLLKEKVIPIRQQALAYSDKWVNAMQLNRLYLLQMQKGLFEIGLDYLSARMELSHVLADLEFHLGGKFPGTH